MNFRKLLTYLTVGTAAVIPFAGAQNPTILQGSYISNVFGNSNFVLNPNAQTNVANVTNATRSTTTPLVATSEFTLALASGANATWTLRAFDSGMKGQNCEARFSYRGFATATTKAEIVQNSLVVAHLVLTPSTDPRIASINFPCGDLAHLTTFRIAQTTAAMTGTNEIGGIYVGLATNMANVAQASKVGGWDGFLCGGEPILNTGTGVWSTPNVAGSCSGTPVGSASAALSNLNTLTFGFSNLPPGEYVFMIPAYVYPGTVTSGTARCDARIKETTLGLLDNGNSFGFGSTTSQFSIGQITQFKFQNTVTANRIFQIELNRSNGLGNCNAGTLNFAQNVSLYRFPSSSELVVTPERQNTFGGVKITAASATVSNSVITAAWTPLQASGAASPVVTTRTNFGKTKIESTNDYKISIDNMPVGNYQISFSATMYTQSNNDRTQCFYGLADTSTGGAQIAGVSQDAFGDVTTATQFNVMSTIQGVYNNTSVANRTFFIQAYRAVGTGSCNLIIDTNRPATFTIAPLDQPSNSALYVQGPVLSGQTGAAIPAGYVFEQTSSSPGITITNNVAGIQNITSFTLNPGVWMVEANCVFRSNGGTATTVWNFAAAMIADANNSTAGTDDMSYSYAFLGHINVASQYSPIFIKRYINVTSATTYYLNTQNSYGAYNPSVACNLKRTRLN